MKPREAFLWSTTVTAVLLAGSALAYIARADCIIEHEVLSLELVTLEALTPTDAARIEQERAALSADATVEGDSTYHASNREQIHWYFGTGDEQAFVSLEQAAR